MAGTDFGKKGRELHNSSVSHNKLSPQALRWELNRRKRESRKQRKHALDQESKNQESNDNDQEKRRKEKENAN